MSQWLVWWFSDSSFQWGEMHLHPWLSGVVQASLAMVKWWNVTSKGEAGCFFYLSQCVYTSISLYIYYIFVILCICFTFVLSIDIFQNCIVYFNYICIGILNSFRLPRPSNNGNSDQPVGPSLRPPLPSGWTSPSPWPGRPWPEDEGRRNDER